MAKKRTQKEIDRRKIAAKIKKYRKALKLSQRKLAEKARLSNGHVAEIELGNKSPSMETLRKLSQALEVPVASLLPF